MCAESVVRISRFLDDGALEIDNGAIERPSDIALGGDNWALFVAAMAARRRPCY